MLALQQIVPLIAKVAGAGHPLAVQKVSVLPGTASGGTGGDFARSAIGASEQIKAATGVDLAGIARKLGSE